MFGLFKSNKFEMTYPSEKLCMRPSDLAMPEKKALEVISKRILDLLEDETSVLRARNYEAQYDWIRDEKGEELRNAEEIYSVVLERPVAGFSVKGRAALYGVSFILNYLVSQKNEYETGQLRFYKNVLLAHIWGGEGCRFLNPENVPQKAFYRNFQEVIQGNENVLSASINHESFEKFLNGQVSFIFDITGDAPNEDLFMAYNKAKKEKPWRQL